MMKQKGVAVITGASAGVGRACVRLFAQKGYDIALLARGIDGLEAGSREVEELGRKSVIFRVDMADHEEIESVTEMIETKLGPIKVWVNNAMNSVFSPISEMTAAEYKRVTEVTYLGQVYGTLSVLKRMSARGEGSIVFVGSALAYRGIPLQSAYCGAKHAVEGFYDSLRTELLHEKSKIQISIVELPALNTTQFGFVKNRLPFKPKPMGKIYQPEVAADAILYAAENNRREIFVGFSTVKAIVGNKIAPWYADRVLANSAFKGQQTNEPEDPDRKNNLWEPIPGDHGARGNFGDKAKNYSFTLLLSKNHLVVYLVTIILVLGLLWFLIE